LVPGTIGGSFHFKNQQSSLEKTPRQQPGPLMNADGALIEQPSGEV
jgi:hypothetical protein